MKDDIGTAILIDENRLDAEWCRQSRLVFEWGEKLAEAKFELDEAVIDEKLTRSEVELAIRSDPQSFGLERVTEGAIKSTLEVSAKVITATRLILKMKHRMAVISAATLALEHKKRALEKLVDLHGRNYFSEPNAPEGFKESVENMKKRKVRRGSVRRRRKVK